MKVVSINRLTVDETGRWVYNFICVFLLLNRESLMQIETYSKGHYQILRIKNRSAQIDRLDELQDLITGYLSRGKSNIAVSFSDASYIYSGAVRALIQCHSMIVQNGGDLCIIEPNPGIFDILEMLNIDRVIRVYVGEEFLPS